MSILGFFFIALAFIGCKTAPPVLPAVHPAAALPQNMDAYFYLSVKENSDVLSNFMEKGMGSRYFLDNTSVMYGAVSRNNTKAAAGGGLMIAAKGDYSVGLVEFGIGREDAWTPASVLLAEGEARYYRNKDTGMELAIPTPQLIIMGSGTAERLAHLYAGQAVPPVSDATLGAWESHSAGFFLPRLDQKGLPPLIPAGLPVAARDILVLADPSGAENIDVSGSVSFETPETAAFASVLLRMYFSSQMGAQGMSAAQIRGALKVSVEGSRLEFSGVRFPRKMAAGMLGGLVAENPK